MARVNAVVYAVGLLMVAPSTRRGVCFLRATTPSDASHSMDARGETLASRLDATRRAKVATLSGVDAMTVRIPRTRRRRRCPSPPIYIALVSSLLWLHACLETPVAAADRESSSPSSPYARQGPYDVAITRIDVLPTQRSVGFSPEGVNGEEGQLLCYYPTGPTARGRLFPVSIYVHPTHGFLFETWTRQNDAMLRLLASRGIVVLSPVRVGNLTGVGADAPIVGGLLPGAQASERVAVQRVYPRLQAFVLHALVQVARRSEDDPSFFAPLRRSLDTSRAAIIGFSAGAALAVFVAEQSQRTWPGRVRAVVALAPTMGDFDYGREQFDLRARRLAVPLLMIAGRDDGMGGFEDLLTLGDVAKSAPRIGVVVEGATHCHVYIPIGSQCRGPGEDVGHVAALDRAATSAFMALYLQGDAAATDVVWGGAKILNALGPWSVAVKPQPLVEITVDIPAPSLGVPAVTYAYDPKTSTWVAKLSLAARVLASGALQGRQAACACPTEVVVLEIVRVDGDGEQPRAAPSGTTHPELTAVLDANVPGAGGPMQPVGSKVTAYCAASDDAPQLRLVLEWASWAVVGQSIPSKAATDAVGRPGEGNGGGDATSAFMVRLRGRNTCDGGSAVYTTLRVTPPRLALDVEAQGNTRTPDNDEGTENAPENAPLSG